MFLLSYYAIDIQLLADKAVFRPENSTLYLADTHFGKAGTFRRGGVPLPGGHNAADYLRLDAIITEHNPQRIVFLGDLFHSDINAEWREFTQWRQKNVEVHMMLIQGNHDVLHGQDYRDAGLEVQPEGYDDDGLILNHHPVAEGNSVSPKKPSLCGHVHPGVLLKGPGRQYEKLSCFWHKSSQKQLMLPAFGSFTGLGVVSPSGKDEVFIIADNTVLKL
ncbi:MAG: ligase-associated DNA damage response endonuclease PdeM [Balneolales bacterium]|nr:ligase-associated DNA damage response endonuclease PdeM [Balneolales bacterium]